MYRLCHFDIKPANIFIGEDGWTCKLGELDWLSHWTANKTCNMHKKVIPSTWLQSCYKDTLVLLLTYSGNTGGTDVLIVCTLN